MVWESVITGWCICPKDGKSVTLYISLADGCPHHQAGCFPIHLTMKFVNVLRYVPIMFRPHSEREFGSSADGERAPTEMTSDEIIKLFITHVFFRELLTERYVTGFLEYRFCGMSDGLSASVRRCQSILRNQACTNQARSIWSLRIISSSR